MYGFGFQHNGFLLIFRIFRCSREDGGLKVEMLAVVGVGRFQAGEHAVEVQSVCVAQFVGTFLSLSMFCSLGLLWKAITATLPWLRQEVPIRALQKRSTTVR
ncbi:Uncharacterised protein [Neisseria gonorrhoeae]|uniref:Uncharacterized protein n=1 Tax=Neisseria gonorrhoeae TaxID=485 RepID=A0A378VYB0_NEIGO|nr:Uncharacterised protein [Neisseria gonorrhoeae]